MTQTICIVQPQGAVCSPPHNIRVTLTCERHPPEILQPPSWSAEGPDYIQIRAAASKAGWSRTAGGIWACPECSR